MQREDLAKVCEFLRPHEEELEDAVFMGIMIGAGSKEFHDAWSKIWSNNLPRDREWRSTLYLGLSLLASTALQNAKSKTNWFSDCTNATILSAFPVSEFSVYEKEAGKATDLWVELGGSLFGPAKRMIAPKFDPIWIKLSDYGAPWGVVRIDWLGESIRDVSASSLRDLNINYTPKGWVSDIIERKESERKKNAQRIDPERKKYLLEKLKEDMANTISPSEAAIIALFKSKRDLILREIKKHEDSGRIAASEYEKSKLIDFSEEKLQEELSKIRTRENLRNTPMSELTNLLWTGDPFNPSDFEDVFHVLPMI